MQNIAIKKSEQTGCKGVYIFTKAKLEKPEHFALNDKIEKLKNELAEMSEKLVKNPSKELSAIFKEKQGLFIGMVRELNSICRTEKFVFENIVPTVGRTMIANNLTDATPDNAMRIKYAELGTSTQAPANGDTALIASSYRNAIASETNAANIAYATAFFSAAEVSGTFKEAGIFADGTASAGTGILVSRVAIDVTKGLTETLTIDWTLTIT